MTLEGFNLSIATDQTRWTALQYYDSTTSSSTDTQDLYDGVAYAADDTTTENGERNTRGLVNGAASADGANVWISIHGTGGVLEHGDLGKLDTDGDDRGGDDTPDNYAADSGNDECATHDGGSAKSGKDETDGTLCDAEDVEIETSVTFTDGLGFDCSVERTYTLTCQWDADGGIGWPEACQ